ncbi:hypothetical protein R54767_04860 [Paraburkholderia gardini]|uniref:Uncharacterized protein n=1 Tax=Paraburkholderia gardini TaxID=2823469 RepID=A0ABM8UAA2_9BURK|nr:hypothetical protein R54767_04860 [Paraburkholderia gardini]
MRNSATRFPLKVRDLKKGIPCGERSVLREDLKMTATATRKRHSLV